MKKDNLSRKFEEEDIYKVILLYEYNIKIADIANYFNVNESSIFRIVKKTGAKRLTLELVLERFDKYKFELYEIT